LNFVPHMFRVVFVGLLKSATRTLTKNLNQKNPRLQRAGERINDDGRDIRTRFKTQ
jgi:hypothetical protein